MDELPRELLPELALEPPPRGHSGGLEEATDERTVAQQTLRTSVLGRGS